MRSTIYVVCARIDDAGELIPDSERTYRIDRIDSARRIEHIVFEIPAGFDVNAFRKLPFQIGPSAIDCTFSIPEQLSGSFPALTCGKGSFEEDGLIWHIDAADLDSAAAWAIAYGIRPLAPEELVSAWRARLSEVAHG